MSIIRIIGYSLLHILTLFEDEKELKSERENGAGRNINMIIKELGLTLAAGSINIGVSTRESPYIAHDKLGGLVAPFIVADEVIWQQMATSYKERLEQLYQEAESISDFDIKSPRSCL